MLIKNGLLITLDPERRVITNGSIAIEEDKIVAIGKTNELEKEYSSSEVLDANRKIVMPGLVNAHNHIYQSIIRGLSGDGRSSHRRETSKYFWNIDILKNLGKEECYAAGMLAAVEMLKSGITCTQDGEFINFHKDAIDGIAQSVLDSGMKVALGRACWDMPDLAPEEYIEDVSTAIKESERVISKWHGKGNGRIIIRGESSQLSQVSDEMILATKELARKHGLGWTMHVSPRIGIDKHDLRSDDPSMNRYNKRGIEHLRNLGVLGPDTLLIHCTLITNREIAILAKTNTAVSHCPVANAWGGDPIVTPVPYMLDRGITVGLGTDGAETNDSLNLFQTMKICAMIHKVNLGDGRAMTAEKVLEMSTIDSAKAMQLDNQIGSLEKGKKADIILIDMDTPGLTPNLLTVKNLVYAASHGNSVETVIIDGKIVMEDRVIKTFDEKEALRAGEDAGQRIVRKSGHLERDPFYLTPAPWKYL
jgi:5-methylthioadenosine/S-adenosylhomocysteine deaminase